MANETSNAGTQIQHAGRTLLLRLFFVVLLTSGLNYAVVFALGLNEIFIGKSFEQPSSTKGPPVLFMGSSLAFHAFEHQRIITNLGRPLYVRTCPAASPAELEQLALDVPPEVTAVLPISIFELNDADVSSYRSRLVPVVQTLKDIESSDLEWESEKNLISQYPLTWTKKIFPAAGSSFVLMVKLRDQAAALLGKAKDKDEENTLSIVPKEETKVTSIAEWDAGRIRRNLSALRDSSQGGKQLFGGPKWLALERMIANRTSQGMFILVILPVSEAYRNEFISEAVRADFESRLADLQARHPKLQLVRFDREPGLSSLELYWDILHLNANGRKLLTPRLLRLLSADAL